jgi:FAD/FMN-containing dehydrogenase
MRDAIEGLAQSISGDVIQPGAPGYDDARRTFNALIDRRPRVIVRCADERCVVTSITFAREHDLRLGVRGGGHSVAGHAIVDDGLVIDLSRMRDVRIDPAARVSHVAGGAMWQDLDAPALEHGLAVPGGVYGDTGVAGLTLGGGIGFLQGIAGFTCDNLIGARVVTADGSIVEATDDPELLWALRGGGGNFGVVTRFDLTLHAVGAMYGGSAIVPLADGAILGRWAAMMRSGPDALLPMLVLLRDDTGRPTVQVQFAFVGEATDGAAFARDLLGEDASGHPGLRACTYLDIQAINPIEAFGSRHYWSSTFVTDLDPGLVELLVELSDTIPNELSGFLIEPIHGAARRTPATHAAFGNRAPRFHVTAVGTWLAPAFDEDGRAWARGATARIVEWSSGGLYANYAMPDEPATTSVSERARAAYPPDTYARLQRVKARYDPDNLFRGNLNIAPRGA